MTIYFPLALLSVHKDFLSRNIHRETGGGWMSETQTVEALFVDSYTSVLHNNA